MKKAYVDLLNFLIQILLSGIVAFSVALAAAHIRNITTAEEGKRLDEISFSYGAALMVVGVPAIVAIINVIHKGTLYLLPHQSFVPNEESQPQTSPLKPGYKIIAVSESKKNAAESKKSK